MEDRVNERSPRGVRGNGREGAAKAEKRDNKGVFWLREYTVNIAKSTSEMDSIWQGGLV
jgi:hypothetical protein